QVELPAITERKNVVEHPVVIRKIDHSPHPDRQHVRIERLVALIDHHSLSLRWSGSPGRIQPDDGVGNRFAASQDPPLDVSAVSPRSATARASQAARRSQADPKRTESKSSHLKSLFERGCNVA